MCKKYSQIALKADDKFVPSSPLGLQRLPKSLDAMKICPKRSKVSILEPKGYQNGSQTTRIAKTFLQKKYARKLVKNARHSVHSSDWQTSDNFGCVQQHEHGKLRKMQSIPCDPAITGDLKLWQSTRSGICAVLQIWGPSSKVCHVS